MSWEIALHPQPRPTARSSLQNRSPQAAQRAASWQPSRQGNLRRREVPSPRTRFSPSYSLHPWLVNARTQKSGPCAPWTGLNCLSSCRSPGSRPRPGRGVPAVPALCVHSLPFLLTQGRRPGHRTLRSELQSHVLKTAFLIKKDSLFARKL